MTHENQLGMFIHWGLYSQTQLQDQAFVRYDLPREEYEGLIRSFHPTEYDPEAWVRLAKSAGMKYLCFTAKHHDGFCMWDTEYSDYSIMHTPYGKDVLKLLAEACRKHGLKLSLYYSNPDWHHPFGYNPHSSHQWRAVQTERVDLECYKAYIKNQITELLTNYGEIYTLFWDIPPRVEDKSINELVRKLQPKILINDRGFDQGDFSTPEREYQSPDGQRFERMTEACNSIDMQSWGYRADTDFYSLRHLTASIARVMSMGGSYLLNVGPTPLGTIDPRHAERIRRVGEWYNRMEGCLEGHESDGFDYQLKGADDYRVLKKGNKSYFVFLQGTRGEGIALKFFPSRPKRVRLLNTGKPLPFAVERLPEHFNGKTGVAEHPYLHIRAIPADELPPEPVVIELEW